MFGAYCLLNIDGANLDVSNFAKPEVIRQFRCKKQMREASAIAAPEALKRSHLRLLEKYLRPFMFEMFCFIADPGLQGRDAFEQVVDMPVHSLVCAPVTGDACPYAARSEGAFPNGLPGWNRSNGIGE